MIGSSRRRCVASLLVIAALARSASARAEPQAEALAQVLFDEGLALMSDGRFAEACPKLAESQRLDPAGGTLLNLASCLERLGRLASAYATYNDALSAAIRDGRKDRESTAREKIADLRPRLSHVLLRLPADSNVRELLVDGISIGRSAWGTPLPLDVGPHTLAASAPGCEPWQSTLTLEGEREERTIDVPRLDSLTPPWRPEVLAPRVAPPPPPMRPRSSTGVWLAGAGGALVGAGLVVGLIAYGKKSESDDACPTRTTCTPEGISSMETANALAWGSNITIGVGLVTAVVGGALLLARPRSSSLAVLPGAVTGTF